MQSSRTGPAGGAAAAAMLLFTAHDPSRADRALDQALQSADNWL
jgi:hypothetical protein